MLHFFILITPIFGIVLCLLNWNMTLFNDAHLKKAADLSTLPSVQAGYRWADINILIYLGPLYRQITAISHFTHSPQELQWHVWVETALSTHSYYFSDSKLSSASDMGDVRSVYRCFQDFTVTNKTPPPSKQPAPSCPHTLNVITNLQSLPFWDNIHFWKGNPIFNLSFL